MSEHLGEACGLRWADVRILREGSFHVARLDEGGLLFFSFLKGKPTKNGGVRGLKEVNFKLRLVYRVIGCVATGRKIYYLYTAERLEKHPKINEREGGDWERGEIWRMC